MRLLRRLSLSMAGFRLYVSHKRRSLHRWLSMPRVCMHHSSLDSRASTTCLFARCAGNSCLPSHSPTCRKMCLWLLTWSQVFISGGVTEELFSHCHFLPRLKTNGSTRLWHRRLLPLPL